MGGSVICWSRTRVLGCNPSRRARRFWLAIRPGSIGRPLHGIDVKLAPGGEPLVRSPSLMTGYWKDDAETAHTLDPSGWLSTGDLADIEEGRVFIRGRLREMIVLSIGEKINT